MNKNPKPPSLYVLQTQEGPEVYGSLESARIDKKIMEGSGAEGVKIMELVEVEE